MIKMFFLERMVLAIHMFDWKWWLCINVISFIVHFMLAQELFVEPLVLWSYWMRRLWWIYGENFWNFWVSILCVKVWSDILTIAKVYEALMKTSLCVLLCFMKSKILRWENVFNDVFVEKLYGPNAIWFMAIVYIGWKLHIFKVWVRKCIIMFETKIWEWNQQFCDVGMIITISLWLSIWNYMKLRLFQFSQLNHMKEIRLF